MMQQVNLYTDELRPRKTPLSLAHMSIALSLTVSILAVASFWQYNYWDKGHAKLSKQQTELSRIESSLEGMRQKAKLWVKSEALEAANDRLDKQLQNYEAFTTQLGQNLTVNTAGYTPILVGLAKHKRADLWLTKLVIEAERDGFVLEGKTTTPQAVPEYLQALRAEPVFGGRNFSLFEMKMKDEKPPYLFKLVAGESGRE